MVHQLLALTLQLGAISAERCWSRLQRVPDFSSICEAEFLALVAHLKAQDFLLESGGLLSIGQKAERVFGRKNFLELYAVFTSPQLYRVETASGQVVGSLEQGFVNRLVEEMSSFLLGGRAWKVDKICHSDRVLRVSAAPRGQKPSWGGFVPQLLSFALCQHLRRVLAEETVYPYLDDASQRALADRRADLAPLLARGGLAIQLDDTAARLWTFAGRRPQSLPGTGLLAAEQGAWCMGSRRAHLGHGVTYLGSAAPEAHSCIRGHQPEVI